MFRNLSLIRSKVLTPVIQSVSHKPIAMLYGCDKTMMCKLPLPFVGELRPMSTRSICNETPVGINIMNSLGKLILWNAFGPDGVNVVAINHPCIDLHNLSNSLKFDTVHGKFNKHIEICGECLLIDDKLVKVFHEECPEKIRWLETETVYVIDVSGKMVRAESAMKHIEAGAKKVIIAGPSIDAPMFVKGMNFERYDSCMQVVSNASSSTHCAGPLIKALHDKFGVESLMMNSTHAQRVIDEDELHDETDIDKIIPKSTGAAITLGKILPELQGKVMGQSGRFPVSYLELQLFLCRGDVTIQEIKTEIVRRGECDLKGILNSVDRCVQEKDFINCRYSGVVDFSSIRVIDKYVTIGMWYDNEMGYSNRVLDLTKHMMIVDKDNKINK